MYSTFVDVGSRPPVSQGRDASAQRLAAAQAAGGPTRGRAKSSVWFGESNYCFFLARSSTAHVAVYGFGVEVSAHSHARAENAGVQR